MKIVNAMPIGIKNPQDQLVNSLYQVLVRFVIFFIASLPTTFFTIPVVVPLPAKNLSSIAVIFSPRCVPNEPPVPVKNLNGFNRITTSINISNTFDANAEKAKPIYISTPANIRDKLKPLVCLTP